MRLSFGFGEVCESVECFSRRLEMRKGQHLSYINTRNLVKPKSGGLAGLNVVFYGRANCTDHRGIVSNLLLGGNSILSKSYYQAKAMQEKLTLITLKYEVKPNSSHLPPNSLKAHPTL